MAAYKNGHFEVVEWLLAHVAHLPSDPECNKALLAPMPTDTDLAPQRSKCIELIMKVTSVSTSTSGIRGLCVCACVCLFVCVYRLRRHESRLR